MTAPVKTLGNYTDTFLGGFELSPFINQATLELSFAVPKVTTLNDTLGVEYRCGLADGSLALTGYFDGTAVTGWVLALNTALGTNNNVVSHCPEGSATGKIAFLGQVSAKDWKTPTKTADFVTVSADFTLNLGWHFGALLEGLATVTTTGNGTAVDDGTGNTLTVSGATNATPIVITTTANHNIVTGNTVSIASVSGNTAANGAWTVTVVSPTTFSLNTSVGNGVYTSGGTVFVDTLAGILINQHITALTGTNYISVVKHSTDNISFTTLYTFASMTGIGAQTSGFVAGTIHRYLYENRGGTFSSVNRAISYSRMAGG